MIDLLSQPPQSSSAHPLPPRTMEDLKERYHAISRKLLVAREGGEASVANNSLVRNPFNKGQEVERKRALEALLCRTVEQAAEENAVSVRLGRCCLPAGCGSQAVACDSWLVTYGSPFAGLQNADCRLQIAESRLQPSDCRLQMQRCVYACCCVLTLRACVGCCTVLCPGLDCGSMGVNGVWTQRHACMRVRACVLVHSPSCPQLTS